MKKLAWLFVLCVLSLAGLVAAVTTPPKPECVPVAIVESRCEGSLKLYDEVSCPTANRERFTQRLCPDGVLIGQVDKFTVVEQKQYK